ncbi:UNVERIFIED_CONTAM: lecithin:cholesterol acyltransferase [Acetivibrio alkalicellulosi]
MGEFYKTDTAPVVVFIPGFLATEIYEDAVIRKKLWPVIDPFLHLRMALDSDGEPAIDSVGHYKTYPGEVFETYWPSLGGHYQTKVLLDVLRNEGIKVVKVPYDWRLDFSHENTIKAVDDGIQYALDTYSNGEPVTIVTHSAGGLVARNYLLKNPDCPVANFINIGSPNLGTPRAIKGLTVGDNLGLPILINSISKKMVQNMPSVYQLIPGERFVTVYKGFYNDVDFSTFYYDEHNDITNYNKTKKYIEDNHNFKLYNKGMIFRKKIETGQLTPSIKEYRFVGYRRSNIMQIIRKETSKVSLTENNYELLFGIGDGIVPIKSADMGCNDNAKVYYFNLSHMGLMSNSDVSNINGQIVTQKNHTDIHKLIIDIVKGKNTCNTHDYSLN